MKSCLYPLMGDRIFGWVGDLVDTVALFGTVFGVTPAIGLGARQINRALLFFDPSVDPDNVLIQIIIICIVTCLATISAVSGLKLGIRRLSEICFAVGCFIMISITVMVDARYILNLIVQSFGFFFQHFFDEMLYTDAFESSVASHGALDRGRLIPDGVKTTDGPGDWIIGHKMLGMWMWWCAFSSFVGNISATICTTLGCNLVLFRDVLGQDLQRQNCQGVHSWQCGGPRCLLHDLVCNLWRNWHQNGKRSCQIWSVLS